MRRFLIGVMLVSLALTSACSAGEKPAPGGDLPIVAPPVQGGGGSEPRPMPPDTGSGVGMRTPLDPEALESIDLLQRESMPVQYALVLKGYKSPCENLEYSVAEADAEGKIAITAELVSTAEVCVAMAEAFEITIPLGSYASGQRYSVWLNGVKVAEFRP